MDMDIETQLNNLQAIISNICLEENPKSTPTSSATEEAFCGSISKAKALQEAKSHSDEIEKTKRIIKSRGSISKVGKQAKLYENASSLQFKCKHCSMSFCYMKNLLKHVVIHQEKQFSCEFCGKRFLYESTLGIHRGISHYY